MGIAINIDNLSHHIPLDNQSSFTLLDQVNLTLQPAEQLAIVGASGSGKTTLLSLMAGLEPLQSGRINIQCNQQTLALESIRQHSGFIFQQFHLLPELDALNNVALPLKLKGSRLANQQAMHWLDKVGLNDKYQINVNKLSGGEQQRVAIARALTTQPQIIFADEPTGNLDEHTAHHIEQLLLDVCRENHTSLVLITHNPKFAQRLDKVYQLQQGSLTPCP